MAELTDNQEYCKRMLSQWVGGDHHLGKIHPFGHGIKMSYRGDLATFDSSKLTNLVLLAHRWRVRVSLTSAGIAGVNVCCWKRKESGSLFERHPGLEELAARCLGSV